MVELDENNEWKLVCKYFLMNIPASKRTEVEIVS